MAQDVALRHTIQKQCYTDKLELKELLYFN